MFSRFKKFSLSALVAIFLFVGVSGVFLPEPARAQIPVSVTADVPGAAEKILGIIFEVIKAALMNAGVKMASYALRKVAYDSAVWVASGGKGQGTMAYGNNFGDYLGNVASEAGGVAIEEFSKQGGFNLCKVPDIKIDLALKVGLRKDFGGAAPPTKPACNTLEFIQNWQTGLSKFSKPEALTKAFNVSLQVDDSDFGIYGAAREKIGNKVFQQTKSKQLEREEGQGYKAAETNVSGQVKTPAQDVKKVAGSQTPDETVKSNEDQLNAAVASGDIKVFPTILSIFLSTLSSNIISNFQTKGILPFGLCVGGMGGADCNKLAGSFSGGGMGDIGYDSGGFTAFGKSAAQSFFNYMTAVKIKEPTRYDLISQLNSCPDSPGIYNCRAGDDLINAINQQMTIGEAIKVGILDGNKKLVPDEETKQNNNINCFRDAYCLSNVRALRQVRILPVGFELAVKKSDINVPWTLKQVVDGFYECGADLTVEDINHPYCHLIDPNWVLKAPLAKCNALVNSASLASADVPNRLEECVDLQTCVQTNPDGTCADYAYCTREKNTWKFPADSCSSQFATCRSFQNEAGQTVSYLMNTVDKNYCTQQNVGCRAYSLTVSTSTGAWLAPSFDQGSNSNTGLFLNNQVDTGCSAAAVGCSAFQVASSTSIQLALRKAPDYLGCYDSNNSLKGIQWPTDTDSLATVASSTECGKYAQVCTASEQGCNWYTSADGVSRIPGKFTPAEIVNNQVIWHDQCDAKCVGYNSYREMPTNYSNGVALAYLIPSSGKTCTSQEVGCTGFTNLSTTTGKSEQVEYFTSLRSCLKPSETPDGRGKSYITYEGSAQTGFQLKTYILLPDATGETSKDSVTNVGVVNAPQYFFKDPNELDELNAECNATRYKAGSASLDCRQFNDDAGKIYYRLLSHTIPVTENCTPYRINEMVFYVDSLAGVAAANREDTCLDQNGFWDESGASPVCKMCLSNGKYKNGICLYEGLAGGVANNAGTSQSCSAAADTCRAYKGNAGNNIQNVFSENFEGPNSTDNWVVSASGVSVGLSTVSTHVGEHSLEFGASVSGASAGTPAAFVSPYGVAVDTDGNMYVSDNVNSRIVKLDSRGNVLTTFGRSGTGRGEFDSISDIAIDPNSKYLYAVDSRNHRIQKFDLEGNWIATIGGTQGSGKGEFSNPMGIALDGAGDIYVADTFNKRIQKLKSSGGWSAFYDSVSQGGDALVSPMDVAVDSAGNIYISDFEYIVKLNSNGDWQAKLGGDVPPGNKFSFALGIVVDSQDNILVADTRMGNVVILDNRGRYKDSFGSIGAGRGEFNFPIGIALGRNDNIYIADSRNNRVVRLDSGGGWIGDYDGSVAASSGGVRGSALGNVHRNETFEIGKSYDLTFWAYSDVDASVTVRIDPVNGDASIPFGPASTINIAKGVWKQYRLGPVEYLANTNDARINFLSNTSLPVYLDNMSLTKVADFVYLTKKSLSVDLVCDSRPDDGLPGEALGCSAYKDPQNKPYYLTNFTSLCRESAIGCTGLFDMQNTLSPLADTYNVWFRGIAGATVSHAIPASGGEVFSCVVPAGRTGCFVNIVGHSMDEILGSVTDGSIIAKDSTIAIPSDTSSTNPIYLVASQSASCSEADLGCTYAGIQTFSSTGAKVFTTTTIKNDPGQYSNTLCQAEAVGCSVFTDGTEVNYFKDPLAGGQSFCEYRTNVIAAGGTLRGDGWFQKNPVGSCSNNNLRSCTKDSASTDCGTGNSCSVPDNVACSLTTIYVANTADRNIKKIVPIDFRTTYGTAGTGLGQFGYTNDVALDSSGNIYVVDSGNNRIQKLSPSGDYIRSYGKADRTSGTANGEFKFPIAIAIDSSDSLYVVDMNNHRIQIFNSNGVFIRGIGNRTTWTAGTAAPTPTNGTGADDNENSAFYLPSGIAVDSSGNIYVGDSGNHRVQIFNSVGVFVRGIANGVTWTAPTAAPYYTFGSTANSGFTRPSSIAVGSTGKIYVADTGNNRIQVFSSVGVWQGTYGSLGSGNGQFNHPYGIAVDPYGNMFVADATNNRIQKLNSSGEWQMSFTGLNSPSGVEVDPNAATFVDLCPADQNKCTQFIDHADVNIKSNLPQSYYLIKDEKVTAGDCNGQVSQKAGCVLFEETGPAVSSLSWHTTSSYASSNSKDGALVVPTSNNFNDANLIMKVAQDRECGEWLKPLQILSTYDDQSNSYKETSWGNLSLCDSSGCAQAGSDSLIDDNFYRQRGTGWYDLDYSGYSIGGSYPTEKLIQVNFASTNTSTPDYRLAVPVYCTKWSSGGQGMGMLLPNNCGPTWGTSCVSTPASAGHLANECGDGGTCLNRQCLKFPDGSSISKDFSVGRQICRAYPEIDSPFPSTPAIIGVGKKGGSPFFRNARVCDENNADGNNFKCDCEYRKVQYGDIYTKYWQYDPGLSADRNKLLRDSSTPGVPPEGICLGGVEGTGNAKVSFDGKACSDDTFCGLGGVCELLKSSHSFVGLKGYCLEQDTARHLNADQTQNACLTWYPIQSLAGATDINNQHTEALSDWQDSSKNSAQFCLNSSLDPNPNSYTFNLGFSPAGLKNNFGNGDGYDQTKDQGFGLPQMKITRLSSYNNTSDDCIYDFWGAHSKTSYNASAGKFQICDSAGNNCYDNSNMAATLAGINVDDIEEIDVTIVTATQKIDPPYCPIGSDGQPHCNPPAVSGGHNISRINATKNVVFKFPNVTNNSPQHYQTNYTILTNPDETMDPNDLPMGAVVGGFYRQPNVAGAHFIMLFSSMNQLPTAANGLSGTGINFNNGSVASQWVKDGVTYRGLTGNMSDGSAYPVLYDNTGNNSLWNVQNSDVTGVCPIPDANFVPPSGNQLYLAPEPVLWHAFKLDFKGSSNGVVGKFNQLETFFCGRWGQYGQSGLYRDEPSQSRPSPIGGSCFGRAGWTDIDYSGLGQDTVEYRITIKMRKVCSTVANASINYSSNGTFTDPNRTIPWTNHLWNIANNRNNYIVDPSGLGFDYPRATTPFGSLSITSPPSNRLIKLGSAYAIPPCTGNPTTVVPDCNNPAPLFVAYNLTGESYSSPITAAQLAIGITHLQELYANVAGTLKWDGSNYTAGTYGYSNRTTTSLTPPQIHPLGGQIKVNGEAKYFEAAEKGFSINVSTSTVRTGQDTLPVSLDFFMFANENQMPLREITIDWGDGSTIAPLAGLYRNKRGAVPGATPTEVCLPQDKAVDYGSIKDMTCDNDFFHATNYYACRSTGSFGYTSDPALCDPRNPSSFPDGCCIFHPRVQVKDNWGWCNGTCAGPGCQDMRAMSGNNQCDTASNAPWTNFAGNSVVVKYLK